MNRPSLRRSLAACAALLLLLSLSGCAGGREIEDSLFVLSMAVDPAGKDGLRVTVKAISGSQESAPAGDGKEEEAEAGYLVVSATAPSCLRALIQLSEAMPRAVNLSQLREIVLHQTLAESGEAMSALREIESMFRANRAAVVVVTPGDAGEFIRLQRPALGTRLSQYLDILFRHLAQADLIPPDAHLGAALAAMASTSRDAAVVYASPDAARSVDLPEQSALLGAAIFSGARMTGTLTGEETGLLCLSMGRARTRSAVIGGAQYQTSLRTRVKRSIRNGALHIDIRLALSPVAGEPTLGAEEIEEAIRAQCEAVMGKLQAAGSDAAGFGQIAMANALDIPTWISMDFSARYPTLPVEAEVTVKIQ